ncbi:MAG: hypothetical protein VW405_16525 [Rhodospirillaceae bacterium]
MADRTTTHTTAAETRARIRQSKDYDCIQVRGYYVSKPLEGTDVQRTLN